MSAANSYSVAASVTSAVSLKRSRDGGYSELSHTIILCSQKTLL